jgi:hypothetical protein
VNDDGFHERAHRWTRNSIEALPLRPCESREMNVDQQLQHLNALQIGEDW